MPKVTRNLVRPLPHRLKSGLFLASGDYIADIKPDEGGRIIRRLGKDRRTALRRFEDLVDELERGQEERENPPLVMFLVNTFLPTQSDLRSPRFARDRIDAVCRFLDARHPRLRIEEVRKHHGNALLDFYKHLSPKTRNDNLQKFKQALNHAVDLDLLPANPLARCRSLRVDNRRLRVPTLEDFLRLVDFPVHDERCSDVPTMVLVMGLTGLRPANVFALHGSEVQGDTIQIPPAKMNARAGVEWMQVYDLRHFFASQLAKQGATEQQIGRLLCHVGQSVTSRYVHMDVEDLRPFVEELSERYLQAAGESLLPYHDDRDATRTESLCESRDRLQAPPTQRRRSVMQSPGWSASWDARPSTRATETPGWPGALRCGRLSARGHRA